jgi:hypothetical protein
VNLGTCFVFRLDIVRLANGLSPAAYGAPRFIRPDFNEAAAAAGEITIAIDLPLNLAEGLGFPNDLVAGQVLAVELNTLQHDDGLYQVLGAEVFGRVTEGLVGATVFTSEPAITCETAQP